VELGRAVLKKYARNLPGELADEKRTKHQQDVPILHPPTDVGQLGHALVQPIPDRGRATLDFVVFRVRLGLLLRVGRVDIRDYQEGQGDGHDHEAECTDDRDPRIHGDESSANRNGDQLGDQNSSVDLRESSGPNCMAVRPCSFGLETFIPLPFIRRTHIPNQCEAH
jgi:hypothetical protein